MLLSWVSEVAWDDGEEDLRAAQAAYVEGESPRVVSLSRHRARSHTALDAPVAYAMRSGRD